MVSMNGKLVLVTGATSGIGYYSALEIARMGASVIIVGRNLPKCKTSVHTIQQETGNPSVSYLLADFSSLAEVRSIAQAYLEQHDRLDVLVNNAGAAFLFRGLSKDGFELTFAVNYLSHYLLSNLLMPALSSSPSARVINVSSGSHYNERLDFNDLQTASLYNPYKAYGRSKLANILFSYELARRLSGTHVTSNALTPGMVATDIWKKVHPILTPILFPIIHHFGLTPSQGAQTIIYLATSQEMEGVTGFYYADQHAIHSGPATYDESNAQRLWEVSAKLVGLDGKFDG
jgi:NAD(P)-dependent dehydrogenase (short-subunit alcohol dehydrogenase family)